MNTQDKTYLDQIEKYYNRTLKSYSIIQVGMTPELLLQFGVPKLPLIMLQSTLTKCTRKVTGSRSAHELPRKIIETLPEQIRNPFFLIEDKQRNSIALISDAEDKAGNKILIAILLDTVQHANRVNEIKSVYGKTTLKEYIRKHVELHQLHVIDNKKAEMLSRVLGLQLPMALITSSNDTNIALGNLNVNTNLRRQNKSVVQSLREHQHELDTQSEGNNLENQRVTKKQIDR